MADVDINSDFYSPDPVRIKAGEKVTWTLRQGSHTVTSNPGNAGCAPASAESFASDGTQLQSIGDTFDHTFNAAGSFAYHCEVHGCMMSGTVIVTPN